ncbi:MAG: type II toxin-antitoxin system VapC family toxin, partial [Pedobacter sp.]
LYVVQLLIDTQILIWFQLGHSQLNPIVSELLSDRSNEIYVSDISLYEITIKQTIGKLNELSVNIEDIMSVAKQDDFQFLPVTHKQLQNYRAVPLFPTHRDPFDRLIISVSKTENLPLISADIKFDLYKDFIQLIKA